MTKEQKEQLALQKFRYELRNVSRNELINIIIQENDVVQFWKLISYALFILFIITLVIL